MPLKWSYKVYTNDFGSLRLLKGLVMKWMKKKLKIGFAWEKTRGNKSPGLPIRLKWEKNKGGEHKFGGLED